MKYTVRQATPTGKSDPKYGSEYIVHFNEDDREVRLSKKDAVVAGQEFDGEIKSNAYGAYFKKTQVPYTPQQQAPSGGVPVAASVKPAYNSDGPRQGMCINNAGAFVNLIGDPSMNAEDWANMVFTYANALYKLGDLGQATVVPSNEQTIVPIDEAPQAVKNVFNGAK